MRHAAAPGCRTVLPSLCCPLRCPLLCHMRLSGMRPKISEPSDTNNYFFPCYTLTVSVYPRRKYEQFVLDLCQNNCCVLSAERRV
jgi:hypothetical protein